MDKEKINELVDELTSGLHMARATKTKLVLIRTEAAQELIDILIKLKLVGEK